MRLFTGIALPADVSENLEWLIKRLKPTAKIKWSRVVNLHITTKFIGEWPESRLGELRDVLAALTARDSFPVGVRKLGWYPNERAPRVFWAGVEAPDDLLELAADTSRLVEQLGVKPERRDYSPHLTLARVKGPAALGALKQAVEELPSREFGQFEATSFHLYRSEPRSAGPRYTSLAEYPLDASHE